MPLGIRLATSAAIGLMLSALVVTASPAQKAAPAPGPAQTNVAPSPSQLADFTKVFDQWVGNRPQSIEELQVRFDALKTAQINLEILKNCNGSATEIRQANSLVTMKTGAFQIELNLDSADIASKFDAYESGLPGYSAGAPLPRMSSTAASSLVKLLKTPTSQPAACHALAPPPSEQLPGPSGKAAPAPTTWTGTTWNPDPKAGGDELTLPEFQPQPTAKTGAGATPTLESGSPSGGPANASTGLNPKGLPAGALGPSGSATSRPANTPTGLAPQGLPPGTLAQPHVNTPVKLVSPTKILSSPTASAKLDCSLANRKNLTSTQLKQCAAAATGE